jgi:DNA-binding NarL/FixJ family response regulator
MRVLLADPDRNIRYGLTVLLGEQPDLEIVGEAATRAELLSQAEQATPDLLLMNWVLAQPSAVELLQALHERHPNLAVIILSGKPKARHEALLAGAQGFIELTEPPERLLASIRQLHIARS